MVIQCTECKTRFKLADEKLKPGGIKVRCAKCKHIFAVSPAVPPVEPVVEPPPPEEKAAPEEEVDFGAVKKEPVSAAPPEEEGTPAGEFPFEEEAAGEAAAEFSFEEEPAEEGAAEFSFEEEPAEEGAAEFSFEEEAAEEAAAEFSFEEEAAEEGAAEFSFEEEAAEEAAAEFSFEEEPAEEAAAEFSFEEEPAEEGAAEFSFEEEAAGEAATEFSFEEETAEEGVADFSFEEEAAEEGAGDFSFDESAIGFEVEEDSAFGQAQAEPSDEFDFSEMTFGEEPQPTEPEPEEAPVEPLATFEQAEPVAEPPAPKAAKQVAVPVPAPKKRKSPLSGLMIFTVALLVALTGAAGYFFWQGGTLDIDGIIARISGQSALNAPAGQIELTGLSGVFVTNREAGQMFMISGQAVNEYPEARSAIAVKGVLRDTTGKPVMQQTAFCGNPLDEATLRSLPFAKIEEHMNNQFGDSLSNLNIAAGKSIPFTVVFRNLPEDLAEFTVEVADSKPGSKQ